MIVINKNRIAVCREIEASPETVWDVVTDTHHWPLWGPSLVQVDCRDRYIKLGSTGRLQTVFSFWLSYTIIKFRRLDYWSWRVGPVQATGHQLIRMSKDSCRLCFDMQWWACFYIPICWIALRKIEKLTVQEKLKNIV